MRILRGFEDSSAYRGGYVSIGNFDGVHRGHQQMIATLVEQARRAQTHAVVLTFDPHPIQLLAPDRAPPALTTAVHKAELLAGCGVDCLIQYPTDLALLRLAPHEFLEQIVHGCLAARGLVEGPNFCFGRDRAGTVDTLQRYGAAHGLSVEIVPAVIVGSQVVSSSAVRAAVQEGRIADAVELLGHPYRLSGCVVPGAARGHGLGFATANIAGVETLLPPDGVYAGAADVDGRRYTAGIHLGPSPTFGDPTRRLEVHLLEYSGGALYDQMLSVDLLDRVRDPRQFPSPEALKEQIARDLSEIRSRVTRWRNRNPQPDHTELSSTTAAMPRGGIRSTDA
jgi:riboflavin kinase/FMN adenylyltransferase